jgi:hypothetical protein
MVSAWPEPPYSPAGAEQSYIHVALAPRRIFLRGKLGGKLAQLALRQKASAHSNPPLKMYPGADVPCRGFITRGCFH